MIGDVSEIECIGCWNVVALVENDAGKLLGTCPRCVHLMYIGAADGVAYCYEIAQPLGKTRVIVG